MAFVIDLVPCRTDNYAVLLHDAASDVTILVDAPEEAPIRAALDRHGWQLTHMLITHHHGDHIEALLPLKEDVAVYGPAADAARIPGLDHLLSDGDVITIAGEAIRIIDTPGHTIGHIAFHFENSGLLFAGDTLFALGCGRLFEGTPADMFGSLSRLASLPGDTAVYCGHEYTLSNARFALSVDADNADLITRVSHFEALRAAGKPTLPTTIADERATNPFLRTDSPAIAARIGLPNATAVERLARLREMKNKA